jgi:hypothetical protein
MNFDLCRGPVFNEVSLGTRKDSENLGEKLLHLEVENGQAKLDRKETEALYDVLRLLLRDMGVYRD